MGYWIHLRERHPQVDFVDSRRDWCRSEVVTLVTNDGIYAPARYIVNVETGDHLWQPIHVADGTYRNCDVLMWSPAVE